MDASARERLWNRLALVSGLLVVLVVGATLTRLLVDLSRQRISVSGTVRFGGTPVDRGVIRFQPLSTLTKTTAGAAIVNGRYRIPTRQGLAPGAFSVFISAAEPDPSGQDERVVTLPGRERIPAEYNSKTTQRVEIRRWGRNVFDFDIPAPIRE